MGTKEQSETDLPHVSQHSSFVASRVVIVMLFAETSRNDQNKILQWLQEIWD